MASFIQPISQQINPYIFSHFSQLNSFIKQSNITKYSSISLIKKLSIKYSHSQSRIMKSKTSLPSNKSIKTPTQKLIALKCKQDHFSYKKQLPSRKNYSSYTSAYQQIDHAKNLENIKIQQLRKIIAPASLDHNLLRRSLHESRHFSEQKPTNLPNLKIGSTYQSTYLQRISESIVKGKEQQGFFIKMPWHDNPASNYRKSFESMHVQQHLQKGKPVQDHIKLVKTPFKAQSNYDEQYTQLRLSETQNNSKNCIKNKDHLVGVNCPLKGQSEYKSKFEKNKQNLPSQKSIKSRKQLSLLPEIVVGKKYVKGQNLPKKSLKMKMAQPNTFNMQNQFLSKKNPTAIF